ncbi:MAG: hypothetical protein JOY54_17920 [Acidobacteriaceae bacterium]|nr:hypothetical protein [Acidobacteriaceae bacterium]
MRSGVFITAAALLLGGSLFAQATFEVTGTAIPQSLLEQDYGKLPAGIRAYDLSICNVTGSKQSVVSSEIYQALARSTAALQPVGRQIMLPAIIKTQSRSIGALLNLALSSATGVLSVLSANRAMPPGAISGTALASISIQTVLSHLSPALSNDQVEKFESDVLEPALVLDGGSCVERTVFALQNTPKTKIPSLSFHVR